jgi:hypothetical protein
VDVLSSPAGPGSVEPRLAVAPGGGVMMSWLEPRPSGGHSLQLAMRTGGHWSSPVTIAEGDSFFVNRADFPAVCAFGKNGVAAAWMWNVSATTRAHQVRLALSHDGGRTWGRPEVLHEDREGQEHGFVSLVPQGEGLRAVWLDGHNGKPGDAEGMAEMTLHSRFVAPTGTLTREQEVDDRTCDCCPTSAAAVGPDLLVAYRDRDADEIRDISLTRLEGGRWGPPTPVHQDGWKIAGCPVNGPAIAVEGDRVAVAWFTGARDSSKVLVAFSSDRGRTFGDPVRVDDGRPLGRAGVALLPDGSAAVTWVEGDAPDARVRIRLARDGVRPGPSASIAATRDARGTGFPQVIRDGSRLLFAWTEPGTRPQVRTGEARIR